MQATLGADPPTLATRPGSTAASAPLRAEPAVPMRGGMRLPLQIGLLCLAFLLAVGMARLIPAFQSPDEVVHLFRADMIGNGHLLLQKPAPDAKGYSGGYADQHLVQFAQWMLKIAGPDRQDVSAAWLMDQASQHRWANSRQFVDVAGSAYYIPLIYLPHAVGLAISRHLDWSMRASYDFTRALVTFTVLALLAWAWQLLPPNLLVRALVLMPMSAFQILSPTIDGLCIAMMLVLAGLTIVEYQAPSKGGTAPPCRWRFAAIAGFTFVLVTSRTNLLPLLAIPLLLLCQRFSRARLGAFVLLCAASLGWTLFVLLTTTDARVVRSHTTLQIVQIYLGDPLYFLGLVGSTLADPDKGTFLADSFVGILGWLDAFIPKPAIRGIWAVLAALALLATAYAQREERQYTLLRAVLTACAVASTLLVFFALSVTWNDYPATAISGLQGRYFIIPALLFALAIGPLEHERTPIQQATEFGVGGAMAAYFLLVLGVTLYGRYQLAAF
ncbi:MULTISPECIES: DUF2142 domain-containing protein [unclassified Acidovorax]|uniref:DUF2142 domain-containing protein n=1 Tax=Acidovorax sp. CF316 TaxID=1144317 RepID=UPI0009D988C9